MSNFGTPLKIGILSDTHGLLRPEVIEIFTAHGVEHILHAGDVCSETIIPELEKIAPVSAVRGNSDVTPTCRKLPLVQIVKLSRAEIYLHHGHFESFNFVPSGTNIVVSGHTHLPKIENYDGLLRINPGSAGPRRPGKPASVCIATIYNRARAAKIIEIQE